MHSIQPLFLEHPGDNGFENVMVLQKTEPLSIQFQQGKYHLNVFPIL